MTKTEKKQKARALIMHHMSGIAYGAQYEQYRDEIGEDAEKILYEQMERIAKVFGFDHAWFS